MIACNKMKLKLAAFNGMYRNIQASTLDKLFLSSSED